MGEWCRVHLPAFLPSDSSFITLFPSYKPIPFIPMSQSNSTNGEEIHKTGTTLVTAEMGLIHGREVTAVDLSSYLLLPLIKPIL